MSCKSVLRPYQFKSYRESYDKPVGTPIFLADISGIAEREPNLISISPTHYDDSEGINYPRNLLHSTHSLTSKTITMLDFPQLAQHSNQLAHTLQIKNAKLQVAKLKRYHRLIWPRLANLLSSSPWYSHRLRHCTKTSRETGRILLQWAI